MTTWEEWVENTKNETAKTVMNIARKHNWYTGCSSITDDVYLTKSIGETPIYETPYIHLTVSTDYRVLDSGTYYTIRVKKIFIYDKHCIINLSEDWSIRIELHDANLTYNGRVNDINDAEYIAFTTSNKNELEEYLDQLLSDPRNILREILINNLILEIKERGEFLTEKLKEYFLI